MGDTPRTIFRPAAVRRYVQDREAAMLPRCISPRVSLYLWLLVGVLVAGGAVDGTRRCRCTLLGGRS